MRFAVKFLVFLFLVTPSLMCKPKMSPQKRPEGENVNSPQSSATGIIANHGGDQTNMDSSSHVSLAEVHIKSGFMSVVSMVIIVVVISILCWCALHLRNRCVRSIEENSIQHMRNQGMIPHVGQVPALNPPAVLPAVVPALPIAQTLPAIAPAVVSPPPPPED